MENKTHQDIKLEGRNPQDNKTDQVEMMASRTHQNVQKKPNKKTQKI